MTDNTYFKPSNFNIILTKILRNSWEWIKEMQGRIVLLIMFSALEFFLTGSTENESFEKIIILGEVIPPNGTIVILNQFIHNFPSFDFLKDDVLRELIVAVHLASIFTAFTLFLPKQKLQNVRKGLEKFKIDDFGDFLTKFDETHRQIKDTERLESEYARAVAKQTIIDAIKTQDQILQTDKNAKTVWVASRNLEFDKEEGNMKVVKENLKNGKKYTWITPESSGNKNGLEENIKTMKSKFSEVSDGFTKSDVKTIESNYKIISVPTESCWMLTHDVVVYNYGEPDIETEVYEFTFEDGYLKLSHDSPETQSLTGAMGRIINNQL